MSTEGTIAAVIMLIVGAIWLALPILRRKYATNSEELARQKEREILATTYERTLASLRDVDEDHLTGKLSEADYEAERAYWMEQAAAVLQALEKVGGQPPGRAAKPGKAAKAARVEQPAEAADPDAMLDEAIEQTIANYIKSTR
jgi:hypothetical protein